jgi:hypothetical protein
MFPGAPDLKQAGLSVEFPAFRTDWVDRPPGRYCDRQTTGHLYVIQRTPAYSPPANNRRLPPGYERDWEGSYPERRAVMRQYFAAAYQPVPQRRHRHRHP